MERLHDRIYKLESIAASLAVAHISLAVSGKILNSKIILLIHTFDFVDSDCTLYWLPQENHNSCVEGVIRFVRDLLHASNDHSFCARTSSLQDFTSSY